MHATSTPAPIPCCYLCWKLCEYDAILWLLPHPYWYRSAATLPGEEDIAGLTDLLNPNTLPGRVARISLMTKGPSPETLLLADMRFSPRPFSIPQIPDLSPQPISSLPSPSSGGYFSQSKGQSEPGVRTNLVLNSIGDETRTSAVPFPFSLSSLPSIPGESGTSTPAPTADTAFIQPSNSELPDLIKVE